MPAFRGNEKILMGHMGHLKQQYQTLVERLNCGSVGLPEPKTPAALRGWQELLEIYYSPEEAELVSKMPIRPASLKTVAKRTGIASEVLRPRLEHVCEKGLVMDLVNPETGQVKYVLSPPVVGFFEFSMMRTHDMFPKKELAQALHAYTKTDRAFADEVFGQDTAIGRALVHEDQISEVSKPDVLDWERAWYLIKEAETISLSLCYCRHKAGHVGKACKTPQDTCLSLNGGAEFVIRRKFGEKIGTERALDLLARAREMGLVQIADNVKNRPTYLCNCCGCCCGQLSAINDFGIAAVNPSSYLPKVNEEKCKGCSRCSRACPIAAITMKPVRRAETKKGDLRPVMDISKCIGCGVCSTTCRKSCIEMISRPEKSEVPNTTMERMVRMALERGRLPHLLFDAGQSRSCQFFNRILQALVKMPVADRLFASRQLHSRFIRKALGKVDL